MRDGWPVHGGPPQQELRGTHAGATSAAYKSVEGREQQRGDGYEGWHIHKGGGVVGKTGGQLIQFEDSRLSWAGPGRPTSAGTMNDERKGEGEGESVAKQVRLSVQQKLGEHELEVGEAGGLALGGALLRAQRRPAGACASCWRRELSRCRRIMAWSVCRAGGEVGETSGPAKKAWRATSSTRGGGVEPQKQAREPVRQQHATTGVASGKGKHSAHTHQLAQHAAGRGLGRWE